jgi:hypothetical protein
MSASQACGSRTYPAILTGPHRVEVLRTWGTSLADGAEAVCSERGGSLGVGQEIVVAPAACRSLRIFEDDIAVTGVETRPAAEGGQTPIDPKDSDRTRNDKRRAR